MPRAAVKLPANAEYRLNLGNALATSARWRKQSSCCARFVGMSRTWAYLRPWGVFSVDRSRERSDGAPKAACELEPRSEVSPHRRCARRWGT